MILPLLAYGLVLGGLISAAAHCLDGAARAFHKPTRWLWSLAMAGTALIPAFALLPSSRDVPVTASRTLVPLDAVYGLLDQGPLPAGADPAFLQLLDRPLFLAWMAASLAVISLFVLANLGLRRRAADWTRGHAAGETVLVSDGLGPAVLGLMNPRIVLPPWALALEPEELGWVILHEIEHRRARDPALLATGILLAALAPWNPALWWQLRRLRLAVEADCDGRVLARGVPRRRYGNLLLGVASQARGLFPLASALSERGGAYLERRLQMMRHGVGKRRIGVALGAVVLGGLFLGLACETPTPPGAQEAEDAAGDLVKLAEDGTVQDAGYGFRGAAPDAPTGEGLTRFRIRETEGESSQDGAVVLFRSTESSDAATTQPLVYIDGELLEGGMEAVRGLNPDRIDRIEVVKGAAAQAVFGEDAAGGVIQIFLKK